jgi:hypothetical protein
MSTTKELRQRILELVRIAEALIPLENLPELPPGPLTSGQPDFYPFEIQIWDIGESIRQLINEQPKLRGDRELLSEFLRIARDPRGKRGRQSFVLLFAYKPCTPFASLLIDEIEDPNVCGQVIYALHKMKVPGFVGRIQLFTSHKETWIRNKAKQYCALFEA